MLMTLTRRALLLTPALAAEPRPALKFRQITTGPRHHIFGYIGHVGNTPWNGDDSLMLALEFEHQDRMPRADEAAAIQLLRVADGYRAETIERSLAWNPQQGTMFYWNPAAPKTQFFFNDRDPATGKVFTVLYDVKLRKRLREYRFEGTPVGNGGVRQNGGAFLAINYARMARLRPVTGYPGTWDWTVGKAHPADDGIHKVDIATGERRLLVSFAQLRDVLEPKYPRIAKIPLFINHTLWNRDGSRFFFFVRGGWDGSGPQTERINVPMTCGADGRNLTEQAVFIGGHPEWAKGNTMIGRVGRDLVLYDTTAQRVTGKIGTPEIFPNPEGDTALSRDGKWIVNGWGQGSANRYAVLHRQSGRWVHSDPIDQSGPSGQAYRGDVRNDPAPCWNRAGTQFCFPSLTADAGRTRQLMVATVGYAVA
jgi:hypothetical protein